MPDDLKLPNLDDVLSGATDIGEILKHLPVSLVPGENIIVYSLLAAIVAIQLTMKIVEGQSPEQRKAIWDLHIEAERKRQADLASFQDGFRKFGETLGKLFKPKPAEAKS